MTAATITPWSPRCSPHSTSPSWKTSAIGCGAPASSPASASPPVSSRAAATPPSSRCSIERITTTTWMDSCRINVDGLGSITATIHTTSSGQGHETLVATVVGEVLQIDPDLIRVVRPDSLAMPAVELAGRQPHGDHARRRGVPCRAETEGEADADRRAQSRPSAEDKAVYDRGGVSDPAAPTKLGWAELVNIAHRNYHLHAGGNGARAWRSTHVMQVPTGGVLPDKDGRVQMYPCSLLRIPCAAGVDRSRSRQAGNRALSPSATIAARDQSAYRAAA